MSDDDDDDGAPPDRLNLPTVRAPRAAPRPRGTAFDPPPARFVPGDELGRGGMGRVFAATDVALGRSVAIKQVLTADPVDLAWFEREVRITARLQHPGIVPVLDAGRDADGRPYYVMRRIEGEPLTARVEGRALDDRLALIPHLVAVADAVAYAHAQGVIHRDLKPANLLLGPFGETLVIDWGLAHELAGEPAAVAEAFGTPGFMAPEQARGEEPDRRSDVYALGATLYYVLAGVVPHAELRATEAIARAADDATPELARIPAAAPRDLVAIAAKALAARPAGRYADAGELAADLRRFLTGQLVLAHRYTAAQRAARFVRRHRIAVAVGGIAVAAIAATTVIAAGRVIAERDDAERARDEAVDRGDAELVGRAEALVATDPTSALATLKQLRWGSHLAPRAAAVATAAVATGVAQGDRVHDGPVLALAMSPDGESVASAGADGKLVVHALASRRVAREVQLGGPITAAVWSSATTLACLTGDRGIAELDVATGAHRMLSPAGAAISALGVLRGRLVARTADRIIDVATGETLAAGVTGWHVAPATLVVGTSTGLRWDTLQLTDRPVAIGLIAASSLAGDRIAVDLPEGVVEWKLEGGRAVEIGRWQLAPPGKPTHAERLVYRGTTLYALDWSRAWWRLVPGGQRAFVSLPRASYVAPIPHGNAFVEITGGISLVTDAGTFPLPHRPIEISAVAGADTGRWLAAATRSGEVLSWRLADLLPELRSLPAGPLVGFDDRFAWIVDLDAVVRVERATGDQARFRISPLTSVYFSATGELSVLSKLDRSLTVWSAQARAVATIPGVIDLAHSDTADGGSLFVLDERGAITERAVRHPSDARPIASVPGARAITLGGIGEHVDWLAARLADRIVRVDLRSGARTEIEGRDLDALVFDPLGTLWATAPTGLWRWDGHLPPAVLAPTARGAWLYTMPGGGAMTWSSDGVLYEVDAFGRVTRRVQAEQLRARPVIAADRSSAAWIRPDGIAVLDLATRVMRLQRGAGTATSLALTPNGRDLAATFLTAADETTLAIWNTDRAPVYALAPWLVQHTNATLAPGSDVIAWP